MTTGSGDSPGPARKRVTQLARRGLSRMPAVEDTVRRARRQRHRKVRLEQMFETLSSRYVPEGTGPLDPIDAIDRVESAALANFADVDFLRTASYDGHLVNASVNSVRSLLATGNVVRARSFAQTLQRIPDLAKTGDLCMALVACYDPVPETAWTLFHRADMDIVLRLAPEEYFRLAFAVDLDVARESARRYVDAQRNPAPHLLEVLVVIARACVATRELDLADHTLDRLDKLGRRGTPSAADADRHAAVLHDVAWLRGWVASYRAAGQHVALPAGEVPFAVLDYRQPDREVGAVLDDPVQTLASLGHLARRRNLTYSGDQQLAGFTEMLTKRVKPERVVESEPATVRLYRVDRDATSFSAVPKGTWMLAFGWYQHPIFGLRYDFPFNPRIRPIFVSFHISDLAVLSPEGIEYLRAHGPIGCRDWTSVALLQAASVPAFFSGCLTTTIDTVFPPDPDARPTGTLHVDSRVRGRGTVQDAAALESARHVAHQEVFASVEQGDPAAFARGLTNDLLEARDRVASLRDSYRQVVTSQLHTYLPARSLGGAVEFTPTYPSDPRLEGLAGISDSEFDAVRDGILAKLDVVLGAITAGLPEDEVYRRWAQSCAPDVAAADARSAALGRIAPPSFDIGAACARIQSESVTIERTAAAPDGPEVNIEFSLDGNLKRQMGVVLHSIVSRSSRPIRLFVLCRDHTPDDYARMAREFPTVSFVWLPTDHVDYGRIIGMIKHITVATMDRLLLPDLLPDVDRIVHHDLDALCLADIARLADWDLHGAPLAARDQPHPNNGSGYRSMLRAARRLTTEDGGVGAGELILRISRRHPFDFVVFNAGIMVLDLAHMRADDFGREFLPWAERFGFNDQEVLNAYAGSQHADLDRAWNAFPRMELINRPKIMHWLGPLKPWGRPYVAGRMAWRNAESAYVKRAKAHPAP